MRINVIGDSIAAGFGSSGSEYTDHLIFTGEFSYYRVCAPHGWCALLQKYFDDNKMNIVLINNGAPGARSREIRSHLVEIISPDDDAVMILVGMNDRNTVNGMNELSWNLDKIIKDLKKMNKMIILLTPNPTADCSEYRKDRLYHTADVADAVLAAAEKNKVGVIDLYHQINLYLTQNHMKTEDIIFDEYSLNDGLHPSDRMYELMKEIIVRDIIRLDIL